MKHGSSASLLVQVKSANVSRNADANSQLPEILRRKQQNILKGRLKTFYNEKGKETPTKDMELESIDKLLKCQFLAVNNTRLQQKKGAIAPVVYPSQGFADDDVKELRTLAERTYFGKTKQRNSLSRTKIRFIPQHGSLSTMAKYNFGGDNSVSGQDRTFGQVSLAGVHVVPLEKGKELPSIQYRNTEETRKNPERKKVTLKDKLRILKKFGRTGKLTVRPLNDKDRIPGLGMPMSDRSKSGEEITSFKTLKEPGKIANSLGQAHKCKNIKEFLLKLKEKKHSEVLRGRAERFEMERNLNELLAGGITSHYYFCPAM